MDPRIKDMFDQAEGDLRRPGRDLSNHPFVLGVCDGSLKNAHLARWAEQFHITITAVVPFIAVAFGNCREPEIRKRIWSNLLEEQTGQLSRTKPHPDLLADFAEEVGSDRAQLPLNEPLFATRALLNHWEILLCHRHYSMAMAGMGVGGECQVPATFGKLTNGLEKNYGISAKGRLFFDMHIAVDENHGDEAMEIVAMTNPTDAELKQIHGSIIGTAEAMWNCWMTYTTAEA